MRVSVLVWTRSSGSVVTSKPRRRSTSVASRRMVPAPMTAALRGRHTFSRRWIPVCLVNTLLRHCQGFEQHAHILKVFGYLNDEFGIIYVVFGQVASGEELMPRS